MLLASSPRSGQSVEDYAREARQFPQPIPIPIGYTTATRLPILPPTNPFRVPPSSAPRFSGRLVSSRCSARPGRRPASSSDGVLRLQERPQEQRRVQSSAAPAARRPDATGQVGPGGVVLLLLFLLLRRRAQQERRRRCQVSRPTRSIQERSEERSAQSLWVFDIDELVAPPMASVARSRLVKAASVWVAVQDPKKYQDWDSVMAKSVGAANIPFVLHLLQLPKIVLNARNLLAGNKFVFFAMPWLVSCAPKFVPQISPVLCL